MKYSILPIVLLILSVAFAADRASTDDYARGAAYTSPSGESNAPGLRRIYLTDNDANEATDTVAADEEVLYGPYRFSVERYGQIPDGVFLNVPAGALATGDSLSIGYQVLTDTAITDTSATWTIIDTVAGETGSKTYSALTSVFGNNIIFRLHNPDATEIQVAKPISVIFRERQE